MVFYVLVLCPGIGFLSRGDREIGVLRNVEPPTRPRLEGVPDLPVAPQDEAGLTTTFQTWPRGWFHIPKDPDFPVPS